jgi:hypothetical protein
MCAFSGSKDHNRKVPLITAGGLGGGRAGERGLRERTLYGTGCLGASPCTGNNRVAVNPLGGQNLGSGSSVAIGTLVPTPAIASTAWSSRHRGSGDAERAGADTIPVLIGQLSVSAPARLLFIGGPAGGVGGSQCPIVKG